MDRIRLVANRRRSFIGSYVLGTGFILEPEQAQELIERDPRNKDVLFPYLNGEDLNSRPDCSASRWVINFHDWSEERARSYSEVFDIVERLVKPVRAKNSNRQRRELWWRFTRPTLDLYRAISGLDRVLVVALVSKTLMPAWTSSRQVLSHKIGVFAVDKDEYLAFMSSSFHSRWAWRNSSTMKSDINYSPSDAYETLPHPQLNSRLADLGATLHGIRGGLMTERGEGLTKLYNSFHDPMQKSKDLWLLRKVHELIDHTVADLYGWHDLDVRHDFRETRQGFRYAIDPTIEVEMLDRLLELNHHRHQGEHTGEA
ncbi:type IIL restriction-modification enzyme MmeI [Nocardiopsis sp. FR4]|uniref:type IIL restriction-modification enzyme MmeI n=1 Tax=Nocardiopsis sp. FR4 TaxID=2605985 RepID=UPI001356946C|nr:type IIL restriction-modification enzyme MmeI [Nocardiopsis sp. FR4]